MALRIYDSFDEMAPSPTAGAFAAADDLPKDSSAAALDALPDFGAETGLAQPAYMKLAVEMNQARLALLTLLLENPLAAERLTGHLNSLGNRAPQPSLWEDDPVQGLPDSRACCHPGSSAAGRPRLFPAMLIRIAGQLEITATESLELDEAYRIRLRECRLHLAGLRQKMIVGNIRLVGFIAYKYRITSISHEDLLQEGIVGLIKAVDRFDPERGIRFSTYAVFWIRQAISRLINRQEKVVHLPMALAEKATVVYEIMRNGYLENNRWPSLAEIKSRCSLSMEEIKTVSSYYQSTHALDAQPSADNGEQSLLDTLKQQQFLLPLNELINTNLSLFVASVVASLPEKEATILNMRFGLKNHSEMTLQAIADQLHVTRERVRQIQNQALHKLKQQFGYELSPFLESNDN
ncbi:MAG: RNA polymerase sigma factor RpoD/SigA [Methylococcales bacterium]|nr:RNA polymerase sigma factor RpoD/SigA [Methylococcales bacterium]